ncbi:MAG TPA: hypothetical protein VFE36_03990, partial [Candidatus Baltobacteraceae bacterium]|nr:hypothetical protein [Candidatus Baltobacteraceae bacterium]
MNAHSWAAAATYTATFAIAAIVAAICTPLIVRMATHLGVMGNVADAGRHMHEVPTPRTGGIAVFFGFAVALFAVLGFALASPFSLLPSALGTHAQKIEILTDRFETVHQLVGLLFGSFLILAVGIWDDVMGMRPRNKFLAQIIVAL